MEQDDEVGALAVVTGADVVEPTRVLTQRQLESDKIRVRILELRSQMSENYFELGRHLFRVNTEGLYMDWRGADGKPYQSFDEYVEKEVDFRYRKAKYLMHIWWWFAETLADRMVMERVKEVGWTKAAILVGVVDAQNVDAWVGKAKSLGVRDLERQAKKALQAANRPTRPAQPPSLAGKRPDTTVDGLPSTKGAALPFPLPASGSPGQARMGVDPLGEGELRDKTFPWTIMLSGEQEQNIDMAIDVASKISETAKDGKGYLLDFVATAFMALHSGARGDEDQFQLDVLRSVERVLGVDIVAYRRGTTEPVYGERTVDRILKEASNADE